MESRYGKINSKGIQVIRDRLKEKVEALYRDDEVRGQADKTYRYIEEMSTGMLETFSGLTEQFSFGEGNDCKQLLQATLDKLMEITSDYFESVACHHRDRINESSAKPYLRIMENLDKTFGSTYNEVFASQRKELNDIFLHSGFFQSERLTHDKLVEKIKAHLEDWVEYKKEHHLKMLDELENTPYEQPEDRQKVISDLRQSILTRYGQPETMSVPEKEGKKEMPSAYVRIKAWFM